MIRLATGVGAVLILSPLRAVRRVAAMVTSCGQERRHADDEDDRRGASGRRQGPRDEPTRDTVMAHRTEPTAPRPNVRMIEGTAPRFTDETADLLRRRLRVFALVLAVLNAIVFLASLSLPVFFLRLAVMLVVLALCLLLWSRTPLSYVALRGIELALFACFAVKSTVTSDCLMVAFARDGAVGPVVVERYFHLAAWSLFIVGYGLIIPNTWRRMLLLAAPAGVAPYVNFYLLGLYDPAVRQVFDSVGHAPPVPITLAAALAAVFGAHTLHSIRR